MSPHFTPFSPPLSWFTLPVTPALHCCSLAYLSCPATLIHAFIIARLDYCSSLYAGLPVGRLQLLDQVLRSAACRSACIPIFIHVSSYMLDVLCWLPLQHENLVPDHCFSLAVLAGPHSGLSSSPLLHYLKCSRSKLSLL